VGPGGHALEVAESEKQKKKTPGVDVEGKEDEDDGGKEDEDDEDEEDEFDDMKERDDILLEKLNEIDKKLEEKLAELDYTFGKKGKVLEEEIRNLAEQRNSLTEKKRRPMYRTVSTCFLFLGTYFIAS
jgi:small subunit ribosomal protein S5